MRKSIVAVTVLLSLSATGVANAAQFMTMQEKADAIQQIRADANAAQDVYSIGLNKYNTDRANFTKADSAIMSQAQSVIKSAQSQIDVIQATPVMPDPVVTTPTVIKAPVLVPQKTPVAIPQVIQKVPTKPVMQTPLTPAQKVPTSILPPQKVPVKPTVINVPVPTVVSNTPAFKPQLTKVPQVLSTNTITKPQNNPIDVVVIKQTDVLKGADGKPGATGKTGATGATGKRGAVGATGAAGKAGTNGTNGANGHDGKNGVDGVNGTNGHDGKDGKQGATGATGKAGTNGTNGHDGRNGVDGRDGANGVNGVTTVITKQINDVKSQARIARNEQRISKVEKRIGEVEHTVKRIGASATATGNLHYNRAENGYAVAVGEYAGSAAIAGGVQFNTSKDTAITVQASYDGADVGASVGFHGSW